MSDSFSWTRLKSLTQHSPPTTINTGNNGNGNNYNNNNNNNGNERRSSVPANLFQLSQQFSQEKRNSLPSSYSPLMQQTPDRRAPLAISQLTTSTTPSSPSVQSIIFPSTAAAPPRRKGASKEVYGFICWITTFVAYGSYILWAYLPEHILKSMGVYYFPKKYWAVALPTYFVVAVGFGVVGYICWNFIHTAPLDSFNTFTDKHSFEESVGNFTEKSIPPIADLPITLINELLYSGDNTNIHSFSGNSKKTSSSLQSSPSLTRVARLSSLTPISDSIEDNVNEGAPITTTMASSSSPNQTTVTMRKTHTFPLFMPQ